MSETIVYTNDKCIGCNKCIKVCSAIGACISGEEDGKARISVDGSKCVACGSCIDVCEHGAREFMDDTQRFFADLEKGEKISLLLAPAFRANYPDEYESVLGGLKKLGVNRIISVSFGADITTWGYLNYIEKYDFLGGISQPCPAVVSYIERYIPELLPKLFPVQSPLMCAAIYARREMGITDRFAFISPCIAKKIEIEDEHNKGLVQYNVTFEHLMRYVHEHNISGPGVHSEIEYGLGSFYPTPGGLAENVRWFLGDQVFIRQVEGERHLYEWMHENTERIKDNRTPFLFIDALNCSKGCICGTAVAPERSKTDDALYELLEIREQSKKDESGNAWSRDDTCEERLRKYNEQFANLDLKDYLRGYSDRSAECRYEIPDDERLEEIFVSMNKLTPEERSINCTCCGYDSCRQMAIAIHNGFNHRENCIYYEKTMVRELEMEKAVAEESAHAKSAFLANMSHEIRTPINTVLGMNEMILRECADRNIVSYSENIRSAGSTLLGLVNNILDFSKIESGKMEIDPVDYDLSSVVNDLVNMIKARADEKSLKLILDFDPSTPKVLHGDELRLKQIITNMLTNAVKYTESGQIIFGISHEDDDTDRKKVRLKVYVEDTGIGIKQEDLSRLFEEFDRLELSRNRNIEGTGLGISITQHLLVLMGSELHVESKYGEGSKFWFILEQDVVRWEELGDYSSAYKELLGRRKSYREKFTAPSASVLVIDDNSMNLTVFASLVKKTKIKVDKALGGDEALAMAYDKKYDIIFFDHMMPNKDGIETLHEMRERPGDPNADTPAICLTANAVSGAREMYLEAGFDDYLAKPIDSVKLENMLYEYLPKDKIAEQTEETAQNQETNADVAPESLPHVIMLSFKNSAIANGIKKKLEKIGYDVTSKVGEFDGLGSSEEGSIFVMYIPPKSGEDTAPASRLADISNEITGSGRKLILIGDTKMRDELAAVLDTGDCLWLDRPVNVDDLDDMIKKNAAGTAIRRILIIDEDPERARSLRGRLKDRYRVDVLTGGDKIERFFGMVSKEDKVDLILLSDSMPPVGRVHIADMLKSSAETARIPVKSSWNTGDLRV